MEAKIITKQEFEKMTKNVYSEMLKLMPLNSAGKDFKSYVDELYGIAQQAVSKALKNSNYKVEV